MTNKASQLVQVGTIDPEDRQGFVPIERINVWDTNEYQDELWGWINSRPLESIGHLSPDEEFMMTIDSDEPQRCIGYGHTYDICNINYEYRGGVLVMHEPGDQYNFTSEERTQQYATVPYYDDSM